MHRIGRTGRAEKKGRSLLLYTEKEAVLRDAIESLMNYSIPSNDFPEEVEITRQLTPEEKEKPVEIAMQSENRSGNKTGEAFHEKSTKNSKEVIYTKSYNDRIKKLHKKPVRRGDKIQNLKKKRKKK
jgi:ATP-dependent RNA helicase RhlE